MAINTVAVSGRLTDAPTVRESASGGFVMGFTVAVNERVRSKSGEWEDRASFVDCSAFGNYARSVSRSMNKGTLVAIQGRLRQDRWQAQDGTRSKLKVVAEQIAVLQSGADGARQQDAEHAGQQAEQYAYTALSDSDCPF